MFNYSFEFYFAKNSFNIQYFGKKFIRILFRKKILRLFIGFTTSRFTRNILLIEICHAKFFNFRIKIIFRDKILYQFNNSIEGPIIELFPVHFNFILIDRQVQFFRFFLHFVVFGRLPLLLKYILFRKMESTNDTLVCLEVNGKATYLKESEVPLSLKPFIKPTNSPSIQQLTHTSQQTSS